MINGFPFIQNRFLRLLARVDPFICFNYSLKVKGFSFEALRTKRGVWLKKNYQQVKYDLYTKKSALEKFIMLEPNKLTFEVI